MFQNIKMWFISQVRQLEAKDKEIEKEHRVNTVLRFLSLYENPQQAVDDLEAINVKAQDLLSRRKEIVGKDFVGIEKALDEIKQINMNF